MQRRKRQMEGRVAATGGGGGGCCRIRKRGCSSTSSSSLVHKGRVKRPILISRRTAMRPLSSSPPARNDELLTHTPSRGGGNGKKAPAAAVSARKLAATLWETNEVPSPRPTLPPPLPEKKYQRRAGRMVAGSQFVDLSNHSPVSKSMDPARTLTHRRRRRTSPSPSPSSLSLPSQGSDSSTSLVEIQCGGHLAASRALLKVLGHVWGMEEQHTSSMSLVSALRVQLQQTRAKIDWLSGEHRSAKNEITYLVKHFAEERAAWKRKERDRIRDAVSSAARELEAERKLRRHTERLNKKLCEELAEADAELKRERRAREALEEVYEEVGRGIGEDRARAEEMEKELAREREEMEKEREEVEREREMLQLADVLREERVQMKLSEARYQLEEKNAAVERLREEVGAYLKAIVGEENGLGSHIFETFHESYVKKMSLVDPCETRGGVEEDNKWQVANEGRQKEHDNDDDDDDDSASGSDLHSIELNMDNNGRCYEWSYACGNGAHARDDPKRSVSVDDRIQWGDISIGRQVSNCGEEEVRRYKSLQSLRDHLMSGASGLEFASQGLASPAREFDPGRGCGTAQMGA